ncbi:MAG TPA: PIN domain-containing protein [Armatimonadota bacterium]|nr:PIN domain-containing protein [Armatimonadota bacterium]
MYLVDTNVWIERLLDQERSEEAGQFLNGVTSDHLFITDFAFHSVAVILSRLKEMDLLLKFVQDTFIDGDVTVCRLAAKETERIILAAKQFSLDFEDAYQYVAADHFNLTLISFDRDFDRTELGRKAPGDIAQTP